MKLFLFGEFCVETVGKMLPSSVVLEESYVLPGLCVCCNSEGRGYLRPGAEGAHGFLLDCSPQDLWVLDQWKNVFLLQRAEFADGIVSYVSIYGEDRLGDSYASATQVEEFFAARASFCGLKRADVHLLIPGYSLHQPPEAEHAYLGKMLQQCIQKSTEAEFNSDFLKDTGRFGLGNIGIVLSDGTVQQAVLTLMRHNTTKLGVLDVYVPAATGSTHGILGSFCGEYIRLLYNGKELSLRDLCGVVGLRPYGSRRSMVFSYEKLTEEQLLNVLVNEEFPMGKIMGSHFKNIIQNNVAQYDTAEVYVSEATMIEITDRIPDCLMDRIASQAVEIFFVEMLLLQDAAVSKMYDRVQEEIEKERNSPFRKDTGKVFEQLLEESSYALNFTDYQQFYYPTVRVSAWRIAEAFGIDAIREKYNRSKEILENMIDRHNAELAKNEDKIENRLLLILAVISGIEPLQIGLNLLLENEVAAYLLSLALLAGLWLCFTCLRKWKRHRMQKKMHSLQNAERKGKKER